MVVNGWMSMLTCACRAYLQGNVLEVVLKILGQADDVKVDVAEGAALMVGHQMTSHGGNAALSKTVCPLPRHVHDKTRKAWERGVVERPLEGQVKSRVGVVQDMVLVKRHQPGKVDLKYF